ncbi:MAG: flagellar basal-body rod protein FlgG [Bdellovibrionales bacterium]|nr:flagellar basal-body rod protein FlgG [Bdellovibrionales bacterium]
MIRALFTSATGMNAQQLKIDNISNNLANINTTGFKKGRTEFQDLMYQQVIEPGAATSQNTTNPTGIQVGLGVRPISIAKVFTQGDLSSTNNQLDIAIEGDGFFEVQLSDGSSAFTRSGAFRLDENSQLVTPDGNVLQPAITIPTDALSVTIGRDGTVEVLQPGSTTPTSVGQITVSRFPNPAGLKAAGQNLYLESEASGTPTAGTPSEDGVGRLTQGFLESSNVSVVEEVVNMILAQRAYEASSKGIRTAEDMASEAINLKR